MAVRIPELDAKSSPQYVINQRARITAANATQTVYTPPAQSYSLRAAPQASGSSGPSQAEVAAQRAAAAAAAAEAAAKKAGKDQTARENANTQMIIDSLLGSLKGYASGRDTQIKNANTSLEAALAGILSNYTKTVADYQKTGEANEQDEASKSAANLTNRARERTSLLEMAASQGAGETDQLRAQIQAFNNADANQLEISRSFFDTERSINSQIAGANNQAETSRRSADNQAQEAITNAWSEFWKNESDVYTNVQRTAAQNSNIDSDYSTGFNPNFGGMSQQDLISKATANVGRVRETETRDEKFFSEWDGKQGARRRRLNSANQAAAVTIAAPKAAEGATLRSEW